MVDLSVDVKETSGGHDVALKMNRVEGVHLCGESMYVVWRYVKAASGLSTSDGNGDEWQGVGREVGCSKWVQGLRLGPRTK